MSVISLTVSVWPSTERERRRKLAFHLAATISAYSSFMPSATRSSRTYAGLRFERRASRKNCKGNNIVKEKKKEERKRATNKEETLDNALQRRRCNAVLLCEGVKGRKEIGHLLSENTDDKVDKLGKLLVAQRVQLLDVAVQLLVWGRSTASEVKLWHPEDGKERKREED